MLDLITKAALPLPNPGQPLPMAWDRPQVARPTPSFISQLPALAIVAVAGQQQVTQ